MGSIARNTKIGKEVESFIDSFENDLSPKLNEELEKLAADIDEMTDELEDTVQILQNERDELREALRDAESERDELSNKLSEVE